MIRIPKNPFRGGRREALRVIDRSIQERRRMLVDVRQEITDKVNEKTRLEKELWALEDKRRELGG